MELRKEATRKEIVNLLESIGDDNTKVKVFDDYLGEWLNIHEITYEDNLIKIY